MHGAHQFTKSATMNMHHGAGLRLAIVHAQRLEQASVCLPRSQHVSEDACHFWDAEGSLAWMAASVEVDTLGSRS